MAIYSKPAYAAALRAFSCFFALLLLSIPLASCNWFSSPANPLELIPLNLDVPADALKSPAVGQLPGDTKLHVRITFKLNQNQLKQAQQQKVQAGQPSRVEQFANKFGIDDATYQKIKNFFNLSGMEFSLSKLHTHLSIDAKASTLAKILQTQFVVHTYNGRQFYAPDAARPAKAPRFLVDAIDAINGLDDYSTPPTHNVLQFTPLTGIQRPAQDCYANSQTLIPTDVAHAYGFDQLGKQGLHGENMTVNLVEIDGAYKTDVQNYFDCINYKGNFQVVNVDGHPSEVLGESTLDIQMVAGLAPASNIKVYQTDASNANSNEDVWVNVNDELQAILNDNTNNANSGNVVSISLGASEGEMTRSSWRALDSSLQQLVQVEHMTVFVASGDCGAFTSRVYNQLSVSYPASDPWVVSVGGTALQVDNNSNRYGETVWSDGSNRKSCQNRWGSGGGNSTLFQRPSWQNAPGVNNSYSRGARQLPDVSAVASSLAVYFNGQWSSVGGTSAAAPIWATGMALVHQGLLQERRTFNSDTSPNLLYQLARNAGGQHPYYDVTQGNNLYYRATAGWDYASGLGTPNLVDFYRAMH